MMAPILTISLSVLLFCSFLTYRTIRKQQKSLAEANQQITRLTNLVEGIVDDKDMATEPAMRVTVRVTDPITLAKRKSIPAQFVGDLAPTLITREVYKQIKKEIAKSLKEQEIDAELKIEIY